MSTRSCGTSFGKVQFTEWDTQGNPEGKESGLFSADVRLGQFRHSRECSRHPLG